MLPITVAYIFILVLLTTKTSGHYRVCGKTNHNTSSGDLHPHNGVIPAGHDCMWHVFPDSFNIPEVFMVVEDFKLESNDRFVISKYDGGELFGPFHGTKEAFTILTGELNLEVSVKITNDPSTERSFSSYYTTNACYYLIEEVSGTMTSPIYKDASHRKSISCTWQFRKFKQVTLPRTVIFETFHLTNSTLMIKGSKAQDGIYSGTKLPPNVIAFGETQFVLNLNTSVPSETFSFRYGLNAVNTPLPKNGLAELADSKVQTNVSSLPNHLLGKGACGSTILRGASGTFEPKDGTIIAGHTCIWEINSVFTEGSKGIFILIKESDLIEDDVFNVRRNNPSEAPLFGPYFGNSGHLSIFTDEQTVDAILTTSKSELMKKRKFQAYYSTEDCNYPISDDAGIISSPFYKTSNVKKTVCSWKFSQHDATSVISVSFEKYNIKSSTFQIEGSINQDQLYKASDGPFDILMKVNGVMRLDIDRGNENENFTFSYNAVSQACSNYTKISGKESTIVEFSPFGSNDINSYDCQWIIEGSSSSVLAVYFDDIDLADAQDLLLITDGKTRTSPKLVQVTKNSQDHIKGSYFISTGNVIWMSFATRFAFKGSHFKINVNISEQEGHLYNGQNFTIQPPKSEVDVIFFLEVKEDEQVLLNLQPEQKLPSEGVILVYNEFSNTALLTTIKHNKPFYPVVSTGSKMMIVARGFVEGSNVTLEFKGVAKGCHQVTLDQHGTYSISGNCDKMCSWTVLPNPNNQEMLSLHLASVALRPDDVIEVYQLDDSMTHVATVTMKENHVPNIYLPAVYGAYVNITRGHFVTTVNDSTAFSASVEIVKGCSMNLDVGVGEKIYLTSPNYPDTYPYLSHCFWNISTSAKYLYTSFESFQLTSGHCLRVHEVDNGHVVDTFTYDSTVTPGDKMLRSSISLELVASNCASNINHTVQSSNGNGFAVKVFAIDCGGVVGEEMKGSISTPDYPKHVLESLLCIWYVDMPFNNSDGSVNVISFDVEWSTASTDDETGLTIYDGPTLHSQAFTNTSISTELLSKTSNMVFVFERDSTSKAQSAVQVYFESRTGNTLCDNGMYMHPDWVCNGIDDCGDYSDEKNCKGRAPLPQPVPPNVVVEKKGVSKTVFWSVVPVMLVAGIILTIATAFVLKEIKRRRESNYDTLPILPP